MTQIEALLDKMVLAHSTPQRQEIAATIKRLFLGPGSDKTPGRSYPYWPRMTKEDVDAWYESSSTFIFPKWKPVEIVAPGEGHPEQPEPLPLAVIGSIEERAPLYETHSKAYPCGAVANGQGPLPDICPVHQKDPAQCVPPSADVADLPPTA